MNKKLIFSKLDNGRFPRFETIVDECAKAKVNGDEEPSSDGAEKEPSKPSSKCIIF